MILFSAVKIYPIKDEHPIIFTGKRHSDCFDKILHIGIERDKEKDVLGFLTDDNKFLDRYEAKHEARCCGQLIRDDNERELLSEDIWPE